MLSAMDLNWAGAVGVMVSCWVGIFVGVVLGWRLWGPAVSEELEDAVAEGRRRARVDWEREVRVRAVGAAYEAERARLWLADDPFAIVGRG